MRLIAFQLFRFLHKKVYEKREFLEHRGSNDRKLRQIANIHIHYGLSMLLQPFRFIYLEKSEIKLGILDRDRNSLVLIKEKCTSDELNTCQTNYSSSNWVFQKTCLAKVNI